MSGLKLNLNDFKSVLGNVNDGNVKVNDDGKLVKVNFGGKITSFFRAKVTVTPEENRKLREAFMAAIVNSREGRTLQQAKLDEIRQQLGLPVGDAQGNEAILASNLTRREIGSILEDICGPDQFGARYESMVNQDVQVLVDRGLADEVDVEVAKSYVNDNPIFQSSASMAAFVKKEIPGKLHGFPAKDIVKFVKNNAAQLKELVFGNILMKTHDKRAQGFDPQAATRETSPRAMLLSCTLQLMEIFGRHSEATFRFGTILPQPPNALETLQQMNTQNVKLEPFRAQLEKFDEFIDAMFVPAAPAEDRPPTVDELRVSSGNVALKLEIRNAILQQIALNGGDVEHARNSEGFKAIKGLLMLSGESAGQLTNDAMTKLRERFFREVADVSFREGQHDMPAIFARFVKVLKPLSEAIDPETHLKAAFAFAQIDGARYDQLKSDLMPEGRLDEGCRVLCKLMADHSIARFSAQLEHPEQDIAESKEYVSVRASLTDAFKSADLARLEGQEARKELIENFCVDTNRDMFPDCLNDEDHKVFRSKMFLMGSVLTPEQCREAGLRLCANNDKRIYFECLGPMNDKQKDVDEAYLTSHNLKAALDAEIEECEKKLDALFKHVSAQEIKAQKQYVTLQTDLYELQFGAGKTKMLDAMRDRLIPDSVGPESLSRFVQMFYAGDPSHADEDLGFEAADIHSLETMKAEYSVRFKAEQIFYPDGAATIRQTLESRLAGLDQQQFPSEQAREDAERQCYYDVIRTMHWKPPYCGFGSEDVVAVFKLLGRCGIDVSKLTADFRLDAQGRIMPPDLDRAMALMQLITLRGGKAAGFVEWFERVSGKPITELSRFTMLDLYKRGITDPLDAIKESTPLGKAVRFFKGEYSIGQAGLTKSERVQLSKAIGELSKRLGGDLSKDCTKTVTVGGVEVQLDIDTEYRQLTATVTVEGRKLPIAYPMDIGDLSTQLQNEIVANLDDYRANEADRNMLLGILPDDAAAANNISRAREICIRVVSRITGRSSVDFASYTMNELRETASGLITGTIAKEDVPQALSQSYNSQEAIELGTSMLTDEAMMNRISWVSVAEPLPPPEQREGVKPSAARIRDFAADLVMNRNTWTFDVESRLQSGERILSLLKGYAPEIRHLLGHPEELDVLEGTVRDTVKTIVDGLRTLAPDIATPGRIEALVFADNAQKLAQIENDVKAMMTAAMSTLQAKITALFVGQNGVEKTTWQRTSAEINGTGGLDIRTPQGKFIKDVLDRYFQSAAEIDQRAMLSAFIRNTAPGDSDGKLAGELIKGAGPLLQKMLQGLPVETFPPETRAALQDTRSNLAPIPQEVVNARLANMITSSNGFITKIEVSKSLGAASVGQAFLCRIYTKDRPCTGEEVVIKILRPNVETAARREFALISEIARQQNNGMDVSFADRYRGILEEFDFTIEAGHIDRGSVYNHAPVGIHPSGDIESMGRYQSVLPTTGALVLQKAEGQPFSNFTRDARKKLDQILEGVRSKVALEQGGKTSEVVVVGGSPADVRVKRMQLDILHNSIIERRKQLSNLVRAWFQQAFEGGFVHGDMHSGNIMTSSKGSTIIDFGNCIFLSEKDRNAVLVALASCVFGEAVNPSDPAIYLLKCIKTLSGPQGQADMEAALADAALLQDLKVSLTRGTKMDVVTRLLSSLTLIQNRGYHLPESITVFTQSLSRLQAALADTDELLGQIEAYADAVEPSEELKAKFSTQDQLAQTYSYFADLDKYLLKSMGGRDIPSKLDMELRDHLTTNSIKTSGETILAELRSQNSELIDSNGGVDFIDLVMSKYGNFKRPCRTIAGGVESAFTGAGITPSLLNRIQAHRALVQRQAPPDEIVASRDKVLKDLLAAIAGFSVDYGTEHDRVRDYDSQVLTFERCGYLALKTVLETKLSGKDMSESLSKATSLFLGSIDKISGTSFAANVGKNYRTYFGKVKAESKRMAQIKNSCSNHNDATNFVTRRNRRLLQRIAADLLVPADGITKTNVNDVIDANLAVARKVLGAESLTLAEMRYFVRLIEQQNWMPNWGFFSSSYDSPFKKLDGDAGAAHFLSAMLSRQNAYLESNGHADLVIADELDIDEEADRMKAAPENQPLPAQEDDDDE